MRIVFIFFLGICMMHDLHNRRIPVVWIWMFIGTAAGYRLYIYFLGRSSIKESLFCMLPGMVLLFFSYAGKQVGSGDGWLIIASGLYLEWEELIKVLCYSFLVAGLFSVGYMLIVHKKRNDRIPFVPFLFLGTIGMFMGDLL